MVKYGNYMSLDQSMLYYVQNKDADKNHGERSRMLLLKLDTYGCRSLS